MSEIPLHLVGDKEISINSEMTILEAARKAGIPFKSACNGQAKCSTCRISVLEGDEHFLPRNPLEEALSLRRSFPCSVRLACQTRISGPARIRRMILEARDLEDIGDEALEAVGDEIKCAILFCDLRDFTPFVENNLAHDVVHILNRFFQHMGEAIVENEGEIDKYIGDAMLAVFHQGQNPALNACLAAKSMYRRLQELNPHLQKFFGLELKFGIGIHFGPVIRGRLGHQSLKSLTGYRSYKSPFSPGSIPSTHSPPNTSLRSSFEPAKRF